MRQATLVFVFDSSGRILLAMKKRWFGVGKWNGAGGKVEFGESLSEAASRELAEEVWVQAQPDELIFSGTLRFTFSENPDWNQEVTVYRFGPYSGAVVETEEMCPKWFDSKDIPYESMWSDDHYWLPRVLNGEVVEFDFTFDANGEVLDFTDHSGSF